VYTTLQPPRKEYTAVVDMCFFVKTAAAAAAAAVAAEIALYTNQIYYESYLVVVKRRKCMCIYIMLFTMFMSQV
jgi:hypothetical protein